MYRAFCVLVVVCLGGCSSPMSERVCRTWYDPTYGDTIDYTLILKPDGHLKWNQTRAREPECEGKYRFVADNMMEWDVTYTRHPGKDEPGGVTRGKETLRVRIDHCDGNTLQLTFLKTKGPLVRNKTVKYTSERPKG